MSLSFLSARHLTAIEAGLALRSMSSPGLNGFGTFFLAGRAAFLTVLILLRPGMVKVPAPPCEAQTHQVGTHAGR